MRQTQPQKPATSKPASSKSATSNKGPMAPVPAGASVANVATGETAKSTDASFAVSLLRRPGSGRRNAAASAVFLLLVIAGILFFGLVFQPEKLGTTGFKIQEYRREAPQSIDALFLGSSHMYCTFSPMLAWQEKGLASYVVAGPEQPMNTTMVTFRNCLATQHPKVAVVELRGLSFKDKVTADTDDAAVAGFYGRLDAAMAGKRINAWPTTLFDFFTYHSRWKELKRSDWTTAAKVLLGRVEPAFYKGFVYVPQTKPQALKTGEPFPIDHTLYDVNLPYLDDIVALARENDCRLVFAMTPAAYTVYFDNYLADVKARYPEIPVVNLNERLDAMGLDFATDMFDSGHTNGKGAAKCTRELLAILEQALGSLPDHRGEAAYAAWDRDLEKYLKATAAADAAVAKP